MKQNILFMAIALLCSVAMTSCGGTSDNSQNEETQNEVVELAPRERIERALDMEDWEEANSQTSKMIENGEQNLPLFEKVWKKEARYIIKKNDTVAFVDLISVISLYNMTTPLVGFQYSDDHAAKYQDDPDKYGEYHQDYKIYKSCMDYYEEVTAFNSIIDDIVDFALVCENKEMANRALFLYRQGVHKGLGGWYYNDRSLNGAKERIANTK